MLARRNPADLIFSLLIVAFGCWIMYSGAQLPVGTMRRIGPGFFPIGLGAILAVLGLASLFDRSDDGLPRGRFNGYGLAFIGLAILSFALLVETTGLFPAVVAMVLLTTLGGRERLSLTVLFATIIGLCATGYVVFIWALRLPLRPFVLGG